MENTLKTSEGIEGSVEPERPGQAIVENTEEPLVEDLDDESNDVAATLRYNHMPIAGAYQVRFELAADHIAGADNRGNLIDISKLLALDPTFARQHNKYEAFRVDNLSFVYQYANNLLNQHTNISVAYVQDPARQNVAVYSDDVTVHRPSTYQFNRVGDYMVASIPCASNWFYTDFDTSRFSSPGSVYFSWWGEHNQPSGVTDEKLRALLPKITVLANVTFKCPTIRSEDKQVEEYLEIEPADFTYLKCEWNDEDSPYPGSLIFRANTKFDLSDLSDGVAFLVLPGTATLSVKYTDVTDEYQHEVTLSRCRFEGTSSGSTVFYFDVTEVGDVGEVESVSVAYDIRPTFRVYYTEKQVFQ